MNCAWFVASAVLESLKTRRPAIMSLALMSVLAVTALPFRVRVPTAGKLSMRTAFKESPVSTSLKPKLAIVKVTAGIGSALSYIPMTMSSSILVWFIQDQLVLTAKPVLDRVPILAWPGRLHRQALAI